MRTPSELLEAATALAADGKLWSAADSLMAGFADLGDAADAPDVDSLGRPIRGSSPKLMDVAADYMDLLDSIEADDPDAIDAEVAEATPPRHMRWAQWHALNGHAPPRVVHGLHDVAYFLNVGVCDLTMAGNIARQQKRVNPMPIGSIYNSALPIEQIIIVCAVW